MKEANLNLINFGCVILALLTSAWTRKKFQKREQMRIVLLFQVHNFHVCFISRWANHQFSNTAQRKKVMFLTNIMIVFCFLFRILLQITVQCN